MHGVSEAETSSSSEADEEDGTKEPAGEESSDEEAAHARRMRAMRYAPICRTNPEP